MNENVALTRFPKFVSFHRHIREEIWASSTIPQTINITFHRVPHLNQDPKQLPRIEYTYELTSHESRTAIFSINAESRACAQRIYRSTPSYPYGRLGELRLDNQLPIWFDPESDVVFLEILSLYNLSKFSTRSIAGANDPSAIARLQGFEKIKHHAIPAMQVNGKDITECRLMADLTRKENPLNTFNGIAGPLGWSEESIITGRAPSRETILSMAGEPIRLINTDMADSRESITTLDDAYEHARADLVSLYTDPWTGEPRNDLSVQDCLAISREIALMQRDMAWKFS